MIRKKIYQWHHKLSLLIALPVMLWATSGFMHPIMTTIRPSISTQFLKPSVIDTGRISMSLTEVLQQNNIENIHHFRLIDIGGNWFYQVKEEPESVPEYFSAINGRRLRSGDQLYAQYLAHQFLNKQETESDESDEGDCCMAAIKCIKKYDQEAKVLKTEFVTDFDGEYRYVNKLLPVYKVSFDREDNIRVYVETTGSRFAYAVNDQRAIFDKIFSLFHNWSWMDILGDFKYIVMVVVLSICLLTTAMGLYIFFTTKSKSANGNKMVKARKNHRWSAVVASLFTLLFAFSGAFHAFEKIGEEKEIKAYYYPGIPVSALNVTVQNIVSKVQVPVTGIEPVFMNDKYFLRVVVGRDKKDDGSQKASRDLMKEMKVNVQVVKYLHLPGLEELADGERVYANQLAAYFSNNKPGDSTGIELITKFSGEYGFTNKRLPVWKVNYSTNGNERYYVETSSGVLATMVRDSDVYEGYSFAFFHKHHFMDWGGKTVRDISTMFWAMVQIVMIATGLTLWWKIRRRNKKPALTHGLNK